jgi:mxaJ protein
MSAHRLSLTTGAVVVAAAAGYACLTIIERPVSAAAQQASAPHLLQLGPRTPPVTDAVPSAFDAAGRRTLLRVCADPNNLPFSNRAGEGFENKLAMLVARDLGLQVAYSWWPQRRGFVRNTLTLGNCDVVMGITAASELVLATRPYYRSTYVFLSRADGPRVRSLDDTALRHLRIGIPLTGGDANPPPAQSLADRGLASQVAGYPLYGDYSKPNPPSALVDAVARQDVDVAIVWGPFAGYFARRERVPLSMTPIAPRIDRGVPYEYAIALGVRRGEAAWRNELQGALDRHRIDIDRLLRAYGVPIVGNGEKQGRGR